MCEPTALLAVSYAPNVGEIPQAEPSYGSPEAATATELADEYAFPAMIFLSVSVWANAKVVICPFQSVLTLGEKGCAGEFVLRTRPSQQVTCRGTRKKTQLQLSPLAGFQDRPKYASGDRISLLQSNIEKCPRRASQNLRLGRRPAWRGMCHRRGGYRTLAAPAAYRTVRYNGVVGRGLRVRVRFRFTQCNNSP